jgi:hypothetical protein
MSVVSYPTVDIPCSTNRAYIVSWRQFYSSIMRFVQVTHVLAIDDVDSQDSNVLNFNNLLLLGQQIVADTTTGDSNYIVRRRFILFKIFFQVFLSRQSLFKPHLF